MQADRQDVLKLIVHLYCTCFILGPLRQDFSKIFRYCCFSSSVFTHSSRGGNPVQTDRGYCFISKITREVSTYYVN